MVDRGTVSTRSFHIKDYPSREAQWVAALAWLKAARGR